VLDAEAMDLPDGSVRALYAQNCFHHFPHPERFFAELVRVLAPGGGAIFVEPGDGPFARLLFTHLFDTEGYDRFARSWDLEVTGPMGGGNQAQSHVIFVRDRRRFETSFPQLEIVRIVPLTNWVRYLVSGGVNFRSLLPQWSEPLLRGVEWLLSPLAPLLALHQLVVLRRRAE
jgi:SAM-dependent methyltransferase